MGRVSADTLATYVGTAKQDESTGGLTVAQRMALDLHEAQAINAKLVAALEAARTVIANLSTKTVGLPPDMHLIFQDMEAALSRARGEQ